jgi:hypothetical protein
MLKFTSAIFLSLVAAATIAQPSLAITTASNTTTPVSAATPRSDLQAQIIFKIGTPEYRREIRRRERERIRRQEARRAARRAYNRNYRRY